jgi:hypothetical protein
MIPGTPVTGLSGVLTHLAKPINVALSKKNRDDPTYVNRACKHMSRITSDYVHEALSQEQVIVQQQKQIEALISMFSDLRSDLNEVQLSHRTAARAAVEKLNNIVPNPFTSYPRFDALDDVFVKAISTMQAHVKVIERTYLFDTRPFDFLVELCQQTNHVATTHKLSCDQQKMMIMHFIPVTNPIYKMIKSFNNLESIFHYVSTSLSVI